MPARRPWLPAAFCLLWLVGLGLPARSAEPPLRLLITPDVREGYERFLAGRNPLQIRDYSGPRARRDVAEIILLLQILDKVAPGRRWQFVDQQSYTRLFSALGNSRADLSAHTVWREDVALFTPGVTASADLVADGEYWAGLFTAPQNTPAMAARSLASLRPLSIVSNRTWSADWRLLESLQFSRIYHVESWRTMLRQVARSRVDLMMAQFPSGDRLELVYDNDRVVALPGVKLILPGARVYVWSSRAELTPLRQAVDRALRAAAADGRLKKLFEQTGFHHPLARDWPVLTLDAGAKPNAKPSAKPK